MEEEAIAVQGEATSSAAHRDYVAFYCPNAIHKRQFPPSSRVLKSRIEVSISDIRRRASGSIRSGIYLQLADEHSMSGRFIRLPVAFTRFGVWANEYRPIVSYSQ